MASRCATCGMRAHAESKPNAIFSKIWRWHTKWCPGWKKYQNELSAQKGRWLKLHGEFIRRKQNGEPIYTPTQKIPNTIVEVGEDYVIVKSSRGRKPRKILAQEVNSGDIEWYTGRRRIILALRELADRLPEQN